MPLTDLNGPMSLQPRSPGLGRISRPTRFAARAFLFLCFATFDATVSRAQNQQDQTVAEAARQERARKQELQKRAKHVYTEEDLKHPSILTPEDREQVEAKRNECAQKNNCPPAQNPPASLDANSETPQVPLGDVARQLRKQKELQALKPKQTEPFHLPFSTPALASPISPERSAIRPPAQRVLRHKTPSNVFRRDPFSAVPVRPRVPAYARAIGHAGVRENIRPNVRPNVYDGARKEVSPMVRPNIHSDLRVDVRPTVRPRAQLTTPTQPKVFSRPAPPSILVQPMQPPIPAEPAQPIAPTEIARPIQLKRSLHFAAIATLNTVSVKPGDSLWKLAKQNLGRGNRWPELMPANPRIVNPNQIRAGAQLNLPVVATAPLTTRSYNSNASLTIKIHKGDTLWSLAKSKLGRSSAWPCLATANPFLSDPNRIYEGQNLLLPAACSSTPSNSPSRASP